MDDLVQEALSQASSFVDGEEIKKTECVQDRDECSDFAGLSEDEEYYHECES